jgi:hypothetical protein
VPSEYPDDDLEPRASRWASLAVPVAVLIVAVAVICALVLGGVLRGDRVRTGPDAAPTTLSTVEINP